MRRASYATDIAITVLATLVIAAIAYGAVARELHRTAVIQPAAASPSPVANAAPSPIELPPPTKLPSPIELPPPTPAGRLLAIDADMVDPTAGWLLLTDCNSAAPSPCHYSVERTDDGGVTWSAPASVGGLYSPQNGDAPRTIRFLDRDNGFVYGHAGAFVTHDGGLTWGAVALQGEIVTIAPFESKVWALNRPCAKGVACAYEVRSSQDAGRTWSPAHQLLPTTSPDALVAFAAGAIVSSMPPGNLEWTADQGVTWREVRSPCAAGQFRGDATSPDGVEIWVLCQAYPDAFGVINDATIFVTPDGGKTWARRGAPGILPAWLVAPAPSTALIDGKGPMLLTSDSGQSWTGVGQGSGPFAAARFLSPEQGWAVDSTRSAWFTSDAGRDWVEVGTLPDTRP